MATGVSFSLNRGPKLVGAKKHIVLGSDGFIGHHISQKLQSSKEVAVLSLSRNFSQNTKPVNEHFFDLCAPNLKVIEEHSPAVLYLCAGYTGLQTCDDDPTGSWVVNVESTWDACISVTNNGGHIVFLSSGQVFDGNVILPDENTMPKPVNNYGIQKQEIEKRIQESGISASIIRLSKVLGNKPTGVFDSWIKSLEAGQPIHPATNMWLAPVSVTLVTDILLAVGIKRLTGLWNLSSNDQISYARAAKVIAKHLNYPGHLVQPEELTDKKLLAEYRPQNSAMNTQKISETLDLKLPCAEDVLLNMFSDPA